jgi:hypothetical protein
MINKFWNVKVARAIGTTLSQNEGDAPAEPPYAEEERHETHVSLKEKQFKMEQLVYRVWTCAIFPTSVLLFYVLMTTSVYSPRSKNRVPPAYLTCFGKSAMDNISMQLGWQKNLFFMLKSCLPLSTILNTSSVVLA